MTTKQMANAIDYYHELLASKHLDSTREMLELATRRDRLSFGDRAVCTVLRPCFIDEATYDYIKRVSTLVMRGLAGLGRRLLADARLRQELDLTANEEAIARIPTGYGSPDVSARLDGFLGPTGQFNFVEYNADSPGGLGYGDALGEAFASMPIMSEFATRFDFRAVAIRDQVFDALIGAYRRWGGSGLPRVAIVDWRGVSTYNEFLMMQSHFEGRGCRVRIADPDELEYRDRRLFIEDFPVDLVYKRVVVGELIAKYGLRHPLVEAARDRAVCVANGFGVQMLYKKATFALASDPAYADLFDAEAALALARHIPWTRKVRECKTNYFDQKIDLVEFIAGNRERLVLKPNGEYGGKGVMLGWECDEAAWSNTLKAALKDSYIVQERVPLGREVYPSLVDGDLRFDERYLDLDPYVWDGERIEGCGVRLSRLALLNVSAGGGSATPMVIVNQK
jgi:uncharacterized circularly permuted ATP-grasp superfamily protein